jgi:hypothetical protein
MLEHQIDQAERRAVMRNEQRVKEQEQSRVFADQSLPNKASTLHQHAVADADIPRGRFSAVEASYVVGSKPDVACAYPATSSAHQTALPPEQPLGYAIDELEQSMPTDAQVVGAPVSGDVPSSAIPFVGDVERGTGAPPRFRRRI